MIDLPELVVDKNSIKYNVKKIVLESEDGQVIDVYYDGFINSYEEYIDPKDLEIKRLLAIIQGLEKPEARKKRTRLTVEEKKDVKDLVEKGGNVKQIAIDYEISDSTIYKWIMDNNWNAPGKRK